MLELHGIVKDGRLLFPISQIELRTRLLASMKNGTRVIETLRREGRFKSYSQVKAHWGLVVEMIRQRMIELGWDICGVAPNKQMIHEILTLACAGVGDSGEIVRLSEQTSVQSSQCFENCRAWAATQLNLDIPDPDPRWREVKDETSEHHTL